MLWGRMLRRTARTEEQRNAYSGWAQGATELESALRDQVRAVPATPTSTPTHAHAATHVLTQTPRA